MEKNDRDAANEFWRWDDVVPENDHAPRRFRQPAVIAPLAEIIERLRLIYKGRSLFRTLRSIELNFIYSLLPYMEKKFSRLFIRADSFFLPPDCAKIIEVLEDAHYIDGIHRSAQFTDVPKFFLYTVPFHTEKSDTDGRPVRDWSGGADLSQEGALQKAISEALERRALACYKSSDLYEASYRDLGSARAVDPELFLVFSKKQQEQSPVRRYRNDVKFRWVRAKDEIRGRDVLLPAQLVFWNYRLEGEPLLRESNTNGNSAGFTREAALGVALKEVIERDAFLCYWMHMRVPTKFSVKSILDESQKRDPLLENFILWAQWYNFDVHFLNITSDVGIPAICAVVRDPSGVGPAVSIGAKAAQSFFEACKGAIMEAFVVYTSFRFRKRAGKLETINPEDFEKSGFLPRGQEARLSLWAQDFMYGKIDWFLAGEERSLVPEREEVYPPPEELKEILRRFKNLGFDVFSYSVHDSLLRRLGLCVVRVVVPQLWPLYLDEANAPLGMKRLGDKGQAQLNFLPHPFP